MSGVVAVAGEGRLAEDLRDAAAEAGYDVLDLGDQRRRAADPRGRRHRPLAARRGADDRRPIRPSCWSCASTAAWPSWTSRAARSASTPCPRSSESRLVELTRGRRDDATGTPAVRRQFFRSLGKHVEWVGDAPGLVLGRIVCQLVNEAAFAVAEGVGVPEDVDTAMRARLQLSARPARVGRRDRAGPRARHARRAPRGVGRGALPRLPRCCAGWSPRAGWARPPAAGSSSTTSARVRAGSLRLGLSSPPSSTSPCTATARRSRSRSPASSTSRRTGGSPRR